MPEPSPLSRRRRPGLSDRAVLDRYDLLCKLVASRGRGLSIRELGDCFDLAREEADPVPDAKRIRWLRDRLDLPGS